MTLGEAWAAWFSGEDIRLSSLWGVQVLWWGRIGKIIQLCVVLLGAIELIGAKRLNQFLRVLAGTTLSAWTAYRRRETFLFLFYFTSYFALIVLLVGKPNPGVMAIMLLALAPVPLGLFLHFVFVRILDRIAILMTHDRAYAFAQLLLVVLFVIGFHFDLLAS